MNDNMTMSHQGLQLTMRSEGLRLTAYHCQADKLTIGYGHTGPDVVEGMTITEERAEDLLREDIKFAESGVRTYVTVPLVQGQFDALTDFAFNMGIGALRSSTLLKKLNSRDYNGASEEFAKWNKVRVSGVLVVSNGQVTRRERDKEIFDGEPA